MVELELSLMQRSPDVAERFLELLREFESQTRIHVNLRLLPWDTARSELTRNALYRHGSDVSEIGTSWVGDFIAMNALRPFTEAEVSQFGPPSDFIPSTWQTCHLYGSDETWAIPWMAESWLLTYRRDLLAQAEIDETEAFLTHKNLCETVDRLSKHGSDIPFEFPVTMNNFWSLHIMASWVWAAGSDFCTPNGKRALFGDSPAIDAIRSFMSLLKYLKPENIELIREQFGSHRLLLGGQSAMSVSLPSQVFSANEATPEVKEQIGIVDLPGAHFVGGSNLVVWKHTLEDQACLELIQFLSDPMRMISPSYPFITHPPRLSVLQSAAYTDDPIRQKAAQSLMTGRTYPSVALLGLIESRLVNAVGHIINSYFANPALDPGELAEKMLVPLAHKLNITLAQ